MLDWLVFQLSIFNKQTEPFEGCSREKILILQMDANKKKVEVNEAFIGEWLKHKYLWDVKAGAYEVLIYCTFNWNRDQRV